MLDRKNHYLRKHCEVPARGSGRAAQVSDNSILAVKESPVDNHTVFRS